MLEVVAYSVFGVSVGLAISRPRVHPRWRIEPAQAAAAGALVMLLVGIVSFDDIVEACSALWRPFAVILSVMVTAAAARRLGVLERLGEGIFRRRDLTPRQLMLRVFVLGVATASLLSNDAAILVLTPLVLVLVKKRYPDAPQLLVPFAFSVFVAAGVAPLVVSNPMNMVVASYANINFNQYAFWMAPIALVGWVVAFPVLLWLFRRPIRAAQIGAAPRAAVEPFTGAQKMMLLLLFTVVAAYPVVAAFNGSLIWVVSVAGATAALVLVVRQSRVSARELLAKEVAWKVLIFLLAIFVLGIGLRNVGLVDRLAAHYTGQGVAAIGVTAAMGSAVLNNHVMAIMNMLALEGTPGSGRRELFAILVGGDLGPRLLPIGSLAGLMWLDLCRISGVEISLRRFVTVGVALTIPTLAVSLLLLHLR